jgi:hypothetical protein
VYASYAGDQLRLNYVWNPPEHDGGLPTVYKVVRDDGQLMFAGVPGTSTWTQETNPQPNRTYTIYAYNRLGTSSGFTAFGPTVPYGVTQCNGTREPAGNSDIISITWSPPFGNGGAPIQGYVVELHEWVNNEPVLRRWEGYDSATRQASFTVDRTKYYQLLVYAHNAYGGGGYCYWNY